MGFRMPSSADVPESGKHRKGAWHWHRLPGPSEAALLFFVRRVTAATLLLVGIGNEGIRALYIACKGINSVPHSHIPC